MARRHNDANVVTLSGARIDAASAETIVATFLQTEFDGGRARAPRRQDHRNRARRRRDGDPRMTDLPPDFFNRPLADVDPEIADVLAKRARAQQRTLEMIASENFVPQAVLECQGSVLTNKYAEGYPGRRYYGGQNEDRRRRSKPVPVEVVVGDHVPLEALSLEPVEQVQVGAEVLRRVDQRHVPLRPEVEDRRGYDE